MPIIYEDLLPSKWEKIINNLVDGELHSIFEKRGIAINTTMQRNTINYQDDNYKFDIVALAPKTILVVDVFINLNLEYLLQFLTWLRLVKTCWKSFDYKNYKIYGAVVFLSAEEKSDVIAANEKLFVIKATKNSALIVNDKDFIPKEF